MMQPDAPAHGDTGWFKSSYSNPSQSCVEVRFDHHAAWVRDSKLGDASPLIVSAASSWAALTRRLKSGMFDQH